MNNWFVRMLKFGLYLKPSVQLFRGVDRLCQLPHLMLHKLEFRTVRLCKAGDTYLSSLNYWLNSLHQVLYQFNPILCLGNIEFGVHSCLESLVLKMPTSPNSARKSHKSEDCAVQPCIPLDEEARRDQCAYLCLWGGFETVSATSLHDLLSLNWFL